MNKDWVPVRKVFNRSDRHAVLFYVVNDLDVIGSADEMNPPHYAVVPYTVGRTNNFDPVAGM